MPTTDNFEWAIPTVGGSTDTWGTELNLVFTTQDTDLQAIKDTADGALPLAGGALTGDITSTHGATFEEPILGNGGFAGNLLGTSSEAILLQNAREFTLSGVVTASAQSFNGSANVTLTTEIADDALSIAKTSGLQTALDAKEATLDDDQKRKITISTADPSGGVDGDIWLKYTA